MKTEEVFKIAADAGLRSAVLLRHYKNQDALTDPEVDELHNILEFARQIAQAEREACAKVCENEQDLAEESKAHTRFIDSTAQKRNIRLSVSRGEHWMAVSTSNAVLRNAARTIRARETQ